jgi:hypothetical protein
VNESLFESEKRDFVQSRCGVCGVPTEAGEMGWITMRHPAGKIDHFDHLCEDCCTRMRDFFETIQTNAA